ncbi:MAG: haloacid dehalogenase-like hydrolase [Deltaproteobacteria bacterium]|nr:haloacid dehalogenase-like hydrolase [Deltaproteobacteria bacterium]
MIRTRGIIVLAALITFSVIFIHGPTSRAVALEPDRTLTYWRGEVRNILLDYIRCVCTPGSRDFIPSKDRVAVFDMDGTLMSEKPFPYVFDAAFRYILQNKDELYEKGPQYKALCEAAQRRDVAYFRKHIAQTFALPFKEKTYGVFRNWCLNVFETQINSLKKRPQKDLIFKPMIELIDLLQARGFQVYVVSGSLQFAIMAISEKYLHVDESHCIGSMVQARAKKEGEKTVFLREELQPPANVNSGKAMRIMMRTGQAPVLAFGNSMGDTWMLDFTASSPYRHMAFVIDHDDPREFVYHHPALLKRAKEKEWVVIRMKESFKTIYGK